MWSVHHEVSIFHSSNCLDWPDCRNCPESKCKHKSSHHKCKHKCPVNGPLNCANIEQKHRMMESPFPRGSGPSGRSASGPTTSVSSASSTQETEQGLKFCVFLGVHVGGAYLAKSDSAMPYSAVQESAKLYLAKPHCAKSYSVKPISGIC